MKIVTRAAAREKLLDLLFSAVADPTRRSMLDRLRTGSLSVTELARPYPISLNAASKHIKTLERAGLIHRTIHGREHSCRLNTARFDEALHWMSHYSEFWTSRLDALESHVIAKRKRGAE